MKPFVDPGWLRQSVKVRYFEKSYSIEIIWVATSEYGARRFRQPILTHCADKCSYANRCNDFSGMSTYLVYFATDGL
ncbi:MAG TPA: hypothetical protein PKD64_17020 [Pirellulaceae bacterium]|nr:hypothetical protein [Pirellulaceae bacterium]HMO93890.1 hypothetical protein [Pirellulaceae bacterium]HMP70889.1 hypothetical protein [Pirellulaceae bacterium]